MLKRYRRLANKIKTLVMDKPLPPATCHELQMVGELKTIFANLPPVEGLDLTLSEAAWNRNLRSLCTLVQQDDPRNFLRWDLIKETMFVSSNSYLEVELDFLKQQPGWETRWRKAIVESNVGHPLPYPGCSSSSGNLIHHAYHIAQFEQKTGHRVHEMEVVFEFGGGYGSMCRLFHQLGFRGKYIIFDLPYFSALQQFYVKSLGIDVIDSCNFASSDHGVFTVSDRCELERILSNELIKNNSMFVATWSISEVPLHLRDSILPLLHNFRSFLIAYQHQFEEVNNIEFFAAWKKTFCDGVAWNDWPIEQIRGNNYLVGRNSMIAKESRKEGCLI